MPAGPFHVKKDLLTSTLAIAAGVTLSVAVPARVVEAQYSPNIQGGGSTLAAPVYRQDFNWKTAILDAFVNGGDGNNLQIRVGPVSGVCSVSE